MKSLMLVDLEALHDAVRDASLNSEQAFPIFRALESAPSDLAANRNRRVRSKFHGPDRSTPGRGYKPRRSERSPLVRKRVSG